MRLRTLSEAECYARCYGAHSRERVSGVRLLPPPASRRPARRRPVATPVGRRPRRHDPRLPHLDRAAPPDGDDGATAGAAAPELVGLHGDVDAAHATLSAAWQTHLARSPTYSPPG